jgi:hypothetical protein
MKKIKELLAEWESAPRTRLTAREYAVHLPIRDAARLEALAEMYPGIGLAGVISDIISAGLDELESAMPYVQGERKIEEDEFGDPMFEDAGPSPRFHQLAREHAKELQRESTRELKANRE